MTHNDVTSSTPKDARLVQLKSPHVQLKSPHVQLKGPTQL